MSWASATAPSHIVYAVLVELLLDTPVRVHSGVGTLAWDSENWIGVGDLGEISALTGGVDMDADDIQLLLSGVPSDYRSELLNAVSRGKRVNIYHGFIDTAAGAWSHEPELAYAGFVDYCQLRDEIAEDGGSSVSISVFVLSAMAYARRRSIARRTDAAHRDLFPDDAFYAFKTNVAQPLPTPAGPSSPSIRPGDYSYHGGGIVFD